MSIMHPQLSKPNPHYHNHLFPVTKITRLSTITVFDFGDVLMRCPSDVNSDVKLKSGNLKWDWNLENREFNFTIEWRLPTLTHT